MKQHVLLLFIFLLYNIAVHAQNYRAIHQKAVVVDTHNDVLSSATMHGLNIENDLTGKAHSDIARFKKGGVDVQVFSVFCDDTFGKDTAFQFANLEIDSLYAIVKRNPAKMMMVTSPADLQKAVRQKKLGCMIGVEGGHMIEDRLDYLDSLYKRGARYLTLTWNNSTSWASSAKDETSNKGADTEMPRGEIKRKGLTDFGRQVVKRMNAMGMMIDLSHVGEQTFYDVIKLTTKPVLLSHSSVYAICPVFRNLKDEQIKAVAKNGGVIQVNFYSGFLDSNYQERRKEIFERHRAERDSLKQLNWQPYAIAEWLGKKYAAEMETIRPPLSLLIDHIDYIVKLVGVDYVGLGADMDGIESLPQELSGVQDYPKVTKALVDRGYNEKDILKVLGGNFIRVFKANSNTALTSQ
ncbi:dipeptidase [Agriterribacter sp.]|uniref:dipeptidase n=1 Tax=Agriterribacter sp. TaxID=2821509 RepID=UPI002BCBACC9|nr:dipeptidase [Agriterribacter sp.]HRO44505.1 dipeptidase [Agriterribacter sp.]HRQ16469.1 dipeptidase [Agriterribacter sp.]